MKQPKTKVAYQNAPKNGQKCSMCTMWRPPNHCTAVAGIISNEGWCNIYEGKKG